MCRLPVRPRRFQPHPRTRWHVRPRLPLARAGWRRCPRNPPSHLQLDAWRAIPQPRTQRARRPRGPSLRWALDPHLARPFAQPPRSHRARCARRPGSARLALARRQRSPTPPPGAPRRNENATCALPRREPTAVPADLPLRRARLGPRMADAAALPPARLPGREACLRAGRAAAPRAAAQQHLLHADRHEHDARRRGGGPRPGQHGRATLCRGSRRPAVLVCCHSRVLRPLQGLRIERCAGRGQGLGRATQALGLGGHRRGVSAGDGRGRQFVGGSISRAGGRDRGPGIRGRECNGAGI
mmetsp:Transcript_48249/g.113899  ORF Transcript_48249/g.113899 Transcript_48249/m.113899 type:complete len:299 (+) Transcript_48249:5431-6327(+)